MDMELGNAFSAGRPLEFKVDRDLQGAFCELIEQLGFNELGYPAKAMHGWTALPHEGWSDRKFVVRAFNSFECECAGAAHQLECQRALANFEFMPEGFFLQWYKYPLRDSYSNKPLTREMIERWKQLRK